MRTASQWGAAFRSRAATPRDAVEESLARIDLLDGQLGAFITVTADLARDQAKESEARWSKGEPRSSLDGVPIALKDTTSTQGVLTTFGCIEYRDYVPRFDSVYWTKLQAAGVVLVGKTNTSEFGSLPATDNLLVERTRNPWDREKTAGGSSGGSTVAVAAGMVSLAEGTDGGGSLRIPSSCCGTVALKPSRGRISAGPNFGAHVGGATNGPIGTNAIDCRLMLDVMQGPDVGDPYPWAGPSPTVPPVTRIGILESLPFAPVDPEVVQAVRKVGHELERMGFTVEPVELPLEGLADPTLWAAALGALPIRDLETVHPMLRDQVVTGREVKAVALEMLNHRFHQRSRALRLAVNEYDAVLLPVLPTLAKPIGFLDSETIDDLLGWLAYTYPANIAGLPSVAFPADRSADGLPIGAQLMGPLNHDEQLLELVAKWEVARGLPHPTAPLSPGA